MQQREQTGIAALIHLRFRPAQRRLCRIEVAEARVDTPQVDARLDAVTIGPLADGALNQSTRSRVLVAIES
jgi:hypothetical protein